MKHYTKEEKEELVRQMLEAIGENPKRQGLKDTPARVVRMWDEVYKGYTCPPPKVTTFKNGTDGIVYDEMIMDEGAFNSSCEHHMVHIVNGKYWFAYIPNKQGQILGLSKVARVVDYFSAKLQIQERLTYEIVNYLWKSLNNSTYKPKAMGLVMEAEHLCKTVRGVKKKGCMRTTVLKGVFKTDAAARAEFLGYVNR
jgi:GTP cyclohydrolase IA